MLIKSNINTNLGFQNCLPQWQRSSRIKLLRLVNKNKGISASDELFTPKKRLNLKRYGKQFLSCIKLEENALKIQIVIKNMSFKNIINCKKDVTHTKKFWRKKTLSYINTSNTVDEQYWFQVRLFSSFVSRNMLVVWILLNWNDNSSNEKTVSELIESFFSNIFYLVSVSAFFTLYRVITQ